VIDRLNVSLPGVPVIVSPLNGFTEGDCSSTGTYGQPNTVGLADWAAAGHMAYRGPDTGPLDHTQLISDNCHLNEKGELFVGAQLVAFFDPPDTEAPSAPTNLRATVSGDDVTLTWGAASDNVGVTGYVVKRNGADIATVTGLTYLDVDVAAAVTHTYTVHAKDAAGNQSVASNGVDVLIADTTPPTVSIDAPAGGTTVSGTVTVTMTATDNVAVSSVQLEVDGATVATLTTAPYNHAWDTTTVANGTHTLTAVATDSAGNATTSAAVSVTVDNTVPAGQFTASAYTATVGQVITFTDAHTGSHRRTITYGDGNTKSGRTQTFTKAYTAAGTYLVTLATKDITTGAAVTLELTVTITTTSTATSHMR